ncbi:MAG: hypothetical protein GY757_58545 [bacterium]|nr:hypothetical protein [bacterium]
MSTISKGVKDSIHKPVTGRFRGFVYPYRRPAADECIRVPFQWVQLTNRLLQQECIKIIQLKISARLLLFKGGSGNRGRFYRQQLFNFNTPLQMTPER